MSRPFASDVSLISGVLFAALALGYATNILKIICRIFFLSERVMSVHRTYVKEYHYSYGSLRCTVT